MSRKKLVVSGDSWTAGMRVRSHLYVNERDKNGHPLLRTDPTKNINPEFKLWPEYLGDMLDMDVVNVGRGGAGNEFIYNNIVDKLSSVKNVGLTIAMWSEHTRWDFIRKITLSIDPSMEDPFRGWVSQPLINHLKPIVDVIKSRNMTTTEYNFLRSLRWYNAFQNYCESNKIPYMQCSAFNAISNDIVSQIIDHPVFYKMKEDHFYGWPVFHQISGFNMYDKLNEIDPDMTKFRVSDENTHPNTEGHKFIAELLYSNYINNEVYDGT
jgi:hypothetical protein|tara:strand:+ start:96 stop:896 length:801 start_codon:yes stop_codon:yes gene_type:complete